ncbi:MAG: hypothetical protein GF355_04765 [Candidatus Eisenbacteria bacterium]|nr:hypothetical protein [Candidatus Eisenbacteria bacterium]
MKSRGPQENEARNERPSGDPPESAPNDETAELNEAGAAGGFTRLRVSVPAVFGSLRTMDNALRIFTERRLPRWRDSQEFHDLRLALREAATNIVEHSLGGDPGARILFEIDAGGNELRLRLRDKGPPFDPAAQAARPPDPEELAEGGYGLFIIRSLVDDIAYDTDEEGNTLTLLKRWKEAHP